MKKDLELNEFIDIIKNRKIIDSFLANTKEEKEKTSGLSKYGKQRLKDSKLINIINAKTLNIDFNYGFSSFVLELDDGTKILFSGSEWNTVEVIEMNDDWNIKDRLITDKRVEPNEYWYAKIDVDILQKKLIEDIQKWARTSDKYDVGEIIEPIRLINKRFGHEYE